MKYKNGAIRGNHNFLSSVSNESPEAKGRKLY